MPIFRVLGPDKRYYDVEAPEGTPAAVLEREVRRAWLQKPAPDPNKQGFGAAMGAAKERALGDLALLAGRTGLIGTEEAERINKAQQAAAAARFTPTEDSWFQSPWQKFKEVAGGSVPAMATTAGAAGLGALAATGLGAPAAAGLAATGLAALASGTQFTMSNIGAQVEAGKRLADTSLVSAVGAAVPQTLLDVGALRMVPGIGQLFGRAGVQITEAEAQRLAAQTLRQKAADYAKAGARVMPIEGVTEAAQQLFERLQAGLSITDEDARKEYFESFMGGAALAGPLGAAGRGFERRQVIRGGEKLKADREDEEAKVAKAEQEQRTQAGQQALRANAQFPALPAPTYSSETQRERMTARIDELQQTLAQRAAATQGMTPEAIEALNARSKPIYDELERLQKALEALGGPLRPPSYDELTQQIAQLNAQLEEARGKGDLATVAQIATQLKAAQQRLSTMQPPGPRMPVEDMRDRAEVGELPPEPGAPSELSGQPYPPTTPGAPPAAQESDAAYQKAVAAVREQNKVSVSLVQEATGLSRKESAKLVQRMEQDGIVSPAKNRRRTVVPVAQAEAAPAVEPAAGQAVEPAVEPAAAQAAAPAAAPVAEPEETLAPQEPLQVLTRTAPAKREEEPGTELGANEQGQLFPEERQLAQTQRKRVTPSEELLKRLRTLLMRVNNNPVEFLKKLNTVGVGTRRRSKDAGPIEITNYDSRLNQRYYKSAEETISDALTRGLDDQINPQQLARLLRSVVDDAARPEDERGWAGIERVPLERFARDPEVRRLFQFDVKRVPAAQAPAGGPGQPAGYERFAQAQVRDRVQQFQSRYADKLSAADAEMLERVSRSRDLLTRDTPAAADARVAVSDWLDAVEPSAGRAERTTLTKFDTPYRFGDRERREVQDNLDRLQRAEAGQPEYETDYYRRQPTEQERQELTRTEPTYPFMTDEERKRNVPDALQASAQDAWNDMRDPEARVPWAKLPPKLRAEWRNAVAAHRREDQPTIEFADELTRRARKLLGRVEYVSARRRKAGSPARVAEQGVLDLEGEQTLAPFMTSAQIAEFQKDAQKAAKDAAASKSVGALADELAAKIAALNAESAKAGAEYSALRADQQAQKAPLTEKADALQRRLDELAKKLEALENSLYADSGLNKAREALREAQTAAQERFESLYRMHRLTRDWLQKADVPPEAVAAFGNFFDKLTALRVNRNESGVSPSAIGPLFKNVLDAYAEMANAVKPIKANASKDAVQFRQYVTQEKTALNALTRADAQAERERAKLQERLEVVEAAGLLVRSGLLGLKAMSLTPQQIDAQMKELETRQDVLRGQKKAREKQGVKNAETARTLADLDAVDAQLAQLAARLKSGSMTDAIKKEMTELVDARQALIDEQRTLQDTLVKQSEAAEAALRPLRIALGKLLITKQALLGVDAKFVDAGVSKDPAMRFADDIVYVIEGYNEKGDPIASALERLLSPQALERLRGLSGYYSRVAEQRLFDIVYGDALVTPDGMPVPRVLIRFRPALSENKEIERRALLERLEDERSPERREELRQLIAAIDARENQILDARRNNAVAGNMQLNVKLKELAALLEKQEAERRKPAALQEALETAQAVLASDTAKTAASEDVVAVLERFIDKRVAEWLESKPEKLAVYVEKAQAKVDKLLAGLTAALKKQDVTRLKQADKILASIERAVKRVDKNSSVERVLVLTKAQRGAKARVEEQERATANDAFKSALSLLLEIQNGDDIRNARKAALIAVAGKRVARIAETQYQFHRASPLMLRLNAVGQLRSGRKPEANEFLAPAQRGRGRLLQPVGNRAPFLQMSPEDVEAANTDLREKAAQARFKERLDDKMRATFEDLRTQVEASGQAGAWVPTPGNVVDLVDDVAARVENVARTASKTVDPRKFIEQRLAKLPIPDALRKPIEEAVLSAYDTLNALGYNLRTATRDSRVLRAAQQAVEEKEQKLRKAEARLEVAETLQPASRADAERAVAEAQAEVAAAEERLAKASKKIKPGEAEAAATEAAAKSLSKPLSDLSETATKDDLFKAMHEIADKLYAANLGRAPSDESASALRGDNSFYEKRATTALPDDVVEALKANDLRGALEKLARSSASAENRETAQRLLANIEGVRVILADEVMLNGARVEGKYNPKSLTITLDRGMLSEETLLHEAAHPATLAELDRASEARRELEKLYRSLQADRQFAREYANTDLGEFVSELLSNRTLRDKIDRRGNFLQRVYRALLKLLGFKSESAKAMQQAYKLFSPPRSTAVKIMATNEENVKQLEDRARTYDDALRASIIDYLRGRGPRPAEPAFMYRGVHHAYGPTPKPGKGHHRYIHASPFMRVALKAGKFSVDGSTAVYAFPVTPGQRYYRAGSLAGDPLESTELLNTKGMTWDEALDVFKARADKAISRNAAKFNRPPTKEQLEYLAYLEQQHGMTREDALAEELDVLVRNVVEDNFTAGMFETDVDNLPGVWTDKTLPRILSRKYPELRRIDEITEYELGSAMRDNVERAREGVAAVLNGVFPATAPQYKSGFDKNVATNVSNIIGRHASMGDRFMANTFGLRLRTALLDRWAPVEAILKHALSKAGGNQLDDMRVLQMRVTMRLLDQVSQLTSAAFTNGVPRLKADKDNGVKFLRSDKGPNAAAIAKALSKANVGNEQATEQLFTSWLAVLRAERPGVGYGKLNFGTGKDGKPLMNAQIAAGIKQQVASDPKTAAAFEEARKIYNAYNNELIELLHEAGVIDKEKRKQLLDSGYVPFYRLDGTQVVLDVGVSRPITIGSVLDQPSLRELVGDTNVLMPVFASMAQNTGMLVRAATRNMQAKAVANMLKDLGMAEIVKGEGPANSLRFKANRMKEADEEGTRTQENVDYFVTIDGSKLPPGVTPDMLITGLQGVKTAIPAGVQVMAAPARLLRKAITRTPVYAARQITRDTVHAWMTTGGNFNPVMAAVSGLRTMFDKASPAELNLSAAGVISSNVFTNDKEDVARMLRDVASGRSTMSKMLGRLDEMALRADAVTRAAVYDSLRQKGASHVEALLGTLESMNFTRRGTSASMLWLSTVIPFFNAQVQGLDAVWRAFTGDTPFEERMKAREKLLERGALLAAGTLAYVLMMQDDEAYKNATPQERAMNWFLPLPGTGDTLRVPIPFELGLIFKAIPETMFNTMVGDTKASEAVNALTKTILASNPLALPTAVKGPLELAANYSFYNDGPIEGQRELSLEPGERARANTSELAKILGSVANVSPIQLEYLVRSYTGSTGIALLAITNPLMRALGAGDNVERPDRTLSELPIIGSLFQPSNGRGLIEAAYDDMARIQRAANTYKTQVEEGRTDAANATARRFSTELALESTAGAFRQQMGELAQLKRNIAASGVSGAEKRQQIDDIKKMEIQLAKSLREAVSAP